MNPAMSSWVALRQRVQFQAGQNVLVLGATGNAGQMAVQIAKLFGADQIIAAGRSAERLAGLPALGATDTMLLGGDADTVTPTPYRRAAHATQRSRTSLGRRRPHDTAHRSHPPAALETP